VRVYYDACCAICGTFVYVREAITTDDRAISAIAVEKSAARLGGGEGRERARCEVRWNETVAAGAV
jgi:hypothetical protein